MRRPHLKLALVLASSAALLCYLSGRLTSVAQAQPPARGELDPEAAELREMERHAQRMGMDLADFLAQQQDHERAMQLERSKQPASLLIHEDSLFVLVDKEWLYQFDAETLELKNMQNLQLLRQDFMQRLERERREQRAPERDEGER